MKYVTAVKLCFVENFPEIQLKEKKMEESICKSRKDDKNKLTIFTTFTFPSVIIQKK